MSWDFICGLLIGACLGLFIAGLISAGRDDKEYITLNCCEKDSESDNEEKEKVEE